MGDNAIVVKRKLWVSPAQIRNMSNFYDPRMGRVADTIWTDRKASCGSFIEPLMEGKGRERRGDKALSC